jgi:hypothetical protein
MSVQDSEVGAGQVRLNDEDVAYLMNLLRNATQPITTQKLIDALRGQSGEIHAGETDASGLSDPSASS